MIVPFTPRTGRRRRAHRRPAFAAHSRSERGDREPRRRGRQPRRQGGRERGARRYTLLWGNISTLSGAAVVTNIATTIRRQFVPIAKVTQNHEVLGVQSALRRGR